MAQIKIPYQNLAFDAPDDNEVFRLSDNMDPYGSTIYSRKGNNVYNLNLDEIYNQYVNPANRTATQGVDPGTRKSAAIEYLKGQGIDYNTIAQKNYIDMPQWYTKGGFTQAGASQDFNLFKPAAVTAGETRTVGINPDNVNATTLQSSTMGNLSTPAPTPSPNAINPGDLTKYVNPNAATQGVTQPMQQPAAQPTAGANVQNTAQNNGISGKASGYTGPSIVDYLNSVGQASDFNSRSALAKSMGITNYSGTADQNTQLLGALRAQEGAASGAATASDSTLAKPTADANNIAGAVTTTNAVGGEKSLIDVVKEISAMMGLTDITDETKKLDDQYADDVKKIADNPWLSEAARSKATQTLDQKYENKKKALVERLATQSDVVAKAVEYYQKERQYKLDVFKATMDTKAKDLDTQVVEVGGRKKLVNMQTGETVMDLGAADVTGGAGGGYTSKQLTALTKLNQDVSTSDTYKKTNSMRGYADNVIASLGLGTGVSDIAAINQFQKVIDEGAVTRDQDVNLIQSAQSLQNSLKTKIKSLESGQKLSDAQRNEIKSAVSTLYDAQVKALLKDPYIQAKTREAELNGLTASDTILGGLGGFSTGSSQNKYKPGQVGTGKDPKTGKTITFIVGPDGESITEVGKGQMSSVPKK